MSNSALYVTLGHNSSAVFADNSRVIRGYEQERLDRKKSSSTYPRDAIELAAPDGVDVAYISHWFDDLTTQSNKYLDLDHLSSFAPEIVNLTDRFTHHDAHAASAGSFFRANGGHCQEADIVVLDGFGTHQECFSVYRARWPLQQPKLAHRTYGYSWSLGLMYQYVVDYLGMKMNQDEYKLLGYESLILAYVPLEHAISVKGYVTDQAIAFATGMLKASTKPDWKGGLIEYGDLKVTQARWHQQCHQWRRMFPAHLDEKGVRACIAFCAQTFLEEAVMSLIDWLVLRGQRPQPHLILTGGCFYNVKLNRRIQAQASLRVFSHPLSGDQGAALGHTPEVDCAGLTWGTRRIGARCQLPTGVHMVHEEAWVKMAATLLEQGRIVNVVRGSMEFGPRALCNTTTFALPTRENVMLINQLNERDEAMPMAPIVRRNAAHHLFRLDELLEIPVSDQFMITTVAFKDRPPERLMGVAHRDPLVDLWTARPQIIDGGPLDRLLLKMPDECLINTSFNYHGEPIVYSEDDACKTHEMQSFRAKILGLQQPVTLLVRS